MKYFDKKNHRLVNIGENASPYFWDSQWDVKNFEKIIRNGKNNRLIIKTTKKYIRPYESKRILEGGCGNGQFVYAFDELGYDSYGIDFAEKTIAKIKTIFPNLKVSIGDVRKLDFPDNFFDGYWSIGVIEHFFEGYKILIEEMERVIKEAGFLFISFPHLSLLRKIKIRLGFYPLFNEKLLKKEEFYEFLLNRENVIKDIESHNFVYIKKIAYAGTKGLKDEISILKPLLQKIYDSNNIILRVLNYGLSLTLSRFSGHSVLLIFRKK